MKTQAEMNVFFQGALWNLAERYTDMVRATHPTVSWGSVSPWYLVVLLQALLWAVGNGKANTSTQPESNLGSLLLGIGTRKLELHLPRHAKRPSLERRGNFDLFGR